ncbi:hypothetical protein [Streptomyces wuyuanensis]
MTVAVKSVRIPPTAITDDSGSMVQKADCFARVSPDERSRSSWRSSTERH